MRLYAVEHHPNDSRINVHDDGLVQTLSGRMGTGGGNVPLVLMCIGGTNANAAINDGTASPTLMNRAGTGGGNVPMVLMESKDVEMLRERTVAPDVDAGRDECP